MTTMFLCTKDTNDQHFFCTNGTNYTISASGRHDFFLHDSFARKTRIARFPQAEDTIFLHERHELHDFRKRKARSIYFVRRKISCRRFIDIVSFVSFVHKISCRRPVDIVSFVSFVQEKIVLSTCRHRIIRAIRARKIVLSTCRHRIIRVLRARKNRAVDLSTSYHSCPSCG